MSYLHPEVERLDEMTRLLAAHGADFNARNSDGKTALDHALARGWTDLANMLRSCGGRTAEELSLLS